MTDEVFGFCIYTSSVSPSGCHLPLKGKALCCCVQHIFDKDTVAGCGIIHQHVGYRINQFSDLYSERAGHADVKWDKGILCFSVVFMRFCR